MSIYTRRGDDGETSLADGSRVRKDAARVEAYGAIDEANSLVGLARSEVSRARIRPPLHDVLRFAQQRLFNCTALLASPTPGDTTAPRITAEDIVFLEAAIDRFEALTGAPAGFVLEGGSQAAARLHVARAALRRAERRTVTLAATESVDEHVLAFLNRLSDTLFAAARYANASEGVSDELWDPNIPAPALSD